MIDMGWTQQRVMVSQEWGVSPLVKEAVSSLHYLVVMSLEVDVSCPMASSRPSRGWVGIVWDSIT